ncbi:hypothetical protein DP57_6108 [Burkholderia pseudomallei]|uniref:hypothetical protein n=1 Tax=Burkholderia pseudomallei TaxID=28450 RepID=UPI0005106EFC|nr:hypothetical protein [Burkholderia pseudomallei]KGC70276.1 hypothetical protein DP57_6108 [Burkholderia pseudomallei]
MPEVKPLHEAPTNSTNVGSSNIDVKVPPEPLAVIHTGTGEIFFIPEKDSTEFTNHYKSLSDAVAEYHSANYVVQLLDEHHAELLCNSGPSCPSLQPTKKALKLALQWQDDAHAKYHQIFSDLDPLPTESKPNAGDSKPATPKTEKEKEDSNKLDGTGKKLIELIALKKLSPEEQAKKAAEEKKVKFDKGTLKKQLASAQSLPALKELGKWPKAPSETLFYVRSDKIKTHWPKAKNLDKTKWSDVVRDEQGNRRFDGKKMRRYVLEQADKKGIDWVKKKFHLDDLEFSRSTTLGQWCEQWNKKAVWKPKDGTWTVKDAAIADWDASAKAQLMRFSYGASLKPDLSIVGKQASVRAEGHAEIDLAKAEAGLKLYFPRKEGWMWYHTGSDGKEYDLVAMMFEADLQASGVAGASIAAELALEVKPALVTERAAPWVKGKPGPKGREARRQNRAELKKGQEISVGSLEAGANIFAGAKADASLQGSLNWRDPAKENKGFAPIATIQPLVGAEVGVGGDARFSIEYTNGMFRCTAHAGLCIGVGAEGAVQFAVGVNEIESFFRCIGTKIAYGNFQNLQIFVPGNFEIFAKIKVMSVLGRKRLAEFVNQTRGDLDLLWQKIYAASTPQDFQRVAAVDPALLDSVPEARAMIASRVIELSTQPQIQASIPDAVPQAKATVLSLLENVTAKPELDNTIQHMTSDGTKASFDAVMAELETFFKLGAAGSAHSVGNVAAADGSFAASFNSIALAGDFRGWYDAFSSTLMEEVPRGYLLQPATSVAYEIQRGMKDHPLYASSGWGAYYTDEA